MNRNLTDEQFKAEHAQWVASGTTWDVRRLHRLLMEVSVRLTYLNLRLNEPRSLDGA